MSVKRKYELCWARTAKGGRLVRGIQEDEDIFVYVPDPEFNCVLQPPIFHPEKSFSVSDKFPQTESGPFSRLPDDVVDNIILLLECKSLDNLLIAIPMLADGVEQRYIRQVQLPCTMKTVGRKKRVLQLSCSVGLVSLRNPYTAALPFKMLNLRFLKELKLVGTNLIDSKFGRVLSPLYLSTLFDLLSQVDSFSLHKVEILTDESTRMCKLAAALAKFRSLDYVSLRGVARNQTFKFRAVSKLISAIKTRKLDLKDFYIKLHSDYSVIVNHTVQMLSLRMGKSMNIVIFQMSNLVEVENLDGMVCICLLHAGHCRLKYMLYEGCPNFKIYNGLDVQNLPDKDKYASWLANIEDKHLEFHDFSVKQLRDTGVSNDYTTNYSSNCYSVLSISGGHLIETIKPIEKNKCLWTFEKIGLDESDSSDSSDS